MIGMLELRDPGCLDTRDNICLNSSPPGQNDRNSGRRHFPINFLEWNVKIPIQIALKFVPRSLIDNKPAVVQVMAWCQTGGKPLPEPMLTQFTDSYIRQ